MASAARSRIPLALGALTVVGGGLWWQTAGARQQPRSASNGGKGVEHTMQHLAGTGGEGARGRPETSQHDPKNTRLMTSSPEVHSKKSADKGEAGGSSSQGRVLAKAQEGR